MPHLLMVEGNLQVQRSITCTLVACGWSVAEAGGIGIAEDMLRVSPLPFDGVILDIQVPDQLGWEWLRRIGKAKRAASGKVIPLIVLSAFPLPPSWVEMLARWFGMAPPAAVILKPFADDTLLAAIEQALHVWPLALPESTTIRVPAGKE